MFGFAVLIGVYSYLIFALGIFGVLYKEIIFFVSFLFISIVLLFTQKTIKYFFSKGASFIKQRSKLDFFLIALLFFQVLVNFIGALGPELGFDALWYHLTLPKIYLENHSINHIPGGLFYYSTMPKLTEMLYVVGLAFGNDIFAKLIHFSFGILSLIALYNLSRKYLSKTFSLLVLVLFYSNLVVGWMSITAYIDLARTFFEIMALWGLIKWIEIKNKKWLIESAVMLGLAVSTKLLSLESLLIFSILIIFYFLHKKESTKNFFIGLFAYWFICLLIPLPWFIFSYIHTGNPLYPFFTSIYPVKFSLNLINPFNLSDPISSLYFIFLPIVVFLYRKFKPSLRVLSLYSFFAIALWFVTPPTGSGRFILPYLPAFSILCIFVIENIKKTNLHVILIGLILFFSMFSIIYRFAANYKYIPVILAKESKAEFLSNHLNFSYGDFYDTDAYFVKKINQKDMVLLYGFHNLYYVNFPFIDSSYVKKGDMFNYIAVQGGNIPERFKKWNLIYYNTKTDIKLYSLGGVKWEY